MVCVVACCCLASGKVDGMTIDIGWTVAVVIWMGLVIVHGHKITVLEDRVEILETPPHPSTDSTGE